MSISIFTYADRNGLQIKFGRTAPSFMRGWYASLAIKGSKLVDCKTDPTDDIISTPTAFGPTRETALKHLCETLRGKLLVVQDFGGSNRIEKRIPTNLRYATSQ